MRAVCKVWVRCVSEGCEAVSYTHLDGYKRQERVAEVSARFSRDAMPGKQMSIDSDMRAGVIDMDEARRRRGLVEKESQMFGSMDGAMKFVKGDAIAGLIIIVVNILGGVTIGVLQRGMSAADALHRYAILTIGDGLIAQIPALLISITAGIIVTRVTTCLLYTSRCV